MVTRSAVRGSAIARPPMTTRLAPRSVEPKKTTPVRKPRTKEDLRQLKVHSKKEDTCGWGREGDEKNRAGVAEHWNAELLGWHVAKRGTRFEALQAIGMAVRNQFDRVDAGAARGLALRHDHGSNFMSDAFQKQILIS